MKTVINVETLRSFAYVNDAVCKKPVKGVALRFMGLGGQSMFDDTTCEGARELGERGILLCVPYVNPWNWMNKNAVRETDEIVDAIFKAFNLPEGTPVVSTGGSMGGQACLVYAKYAAKTPAGCVANCPVCDLPYHYTERPDLPRTLYSSYMDYPCDTIDEALETASPYHLAQNGSMPRIPYIIFHCEKDRAVNKQKHSDRFVEAMKQYNGIDAEYIPVPDRDHCDLPEEYANMYMQKIEDIVNGAAK